MVIDPWVSKKAVFSKKVVFGKNKKSKVSVLMQVAPYESVHTQRICIYM